MYRNWGLSHGYTVDMRNKLVMETGL